MKFTSILKSIILENGKIEFLTKKYLEPKVDKEGKKVKSELTPEIFFQLIQADPKTEMNDVDPTSENKEEWGKVHPGGYSEWIVKNYLNPDLGEYSDLPKDSSQYKEALKRAREEFLEDLSQITIDLQKHLRFKHKIEGERDLNKLTPKELYKKVVNLSLEKTKASKEEKEKASQSFEYPGAEVLGRGSDFTLIRITDTGELGRDAACFYGGYQLRADQGETTWCTSSPGYDSNFKNYIKDGPLYIFIKNVDTKYGTKSKLPAERYQFHFPSQQFKDVHNHNIDLVEFLNGPAKEFKNFFKHEFAKGLTVGGDKFSVSDLSRGNVGKFISLYGLDELINSIPDTIESFSIDGSGSNIIINIPDSIDRFQNLESIVLKNCIDKLPETICNIKSLNFISLFNNTGLKKIPECIPYLPNLLYVNLKGCDNLAIPESFNEKGEQVTAQSWNFAD